MNEKDAYKVEDNLKAIMVVVNHLKDIAKESISKGCLEDAINQIEEIKNIEEKLKRTAYEIRTEIKEENNVNNL